ncbi:uncharacterized protein LOC129802696 [Phlebotomus papatasi]|uniref:uncharacterized protein LOC129802696 n=1 Tax=Phlebotomus papatasi TaxID=29031 RepID=UPI00248402F3|nr:uncharacterized protein LOC129802696 [Phlebotomus papatasi]
MPSKKKKYNARFPPGRIKKIMQTDEEVGKVAQAVPIIISRTLELFVESLLTKTVRITNARHAKTLSPSHMKQCIMSESRFDFLRELVKNVPDISVAEEIDNSPVSSMETPEDRNGGNSLRNGRSTKGDTWLRTYGRPVSMDFAQIGQQSVSHEGKCLTPNVIYPGGSEGNSVIRYTASGMSSQKSTSSCHPPSSSSLRPSKMARLDSSPGCYSAPPRPDDSSIFSFDLKQKPQREYAPQSPLVTSTVTSCTNVTRESVAMTPPPVLKIDICNTPVVKIDYSHLPPLNVAAPTPLPAPPAASELDEDYDNI